LDEWISALPNAGKVLKAATSGSFFSRFMSAYALRAFAVSLVRDQLVCLDDLERRGKDLRPNDVLGLVSFLSEQRNCKVALILDDEGLDDTEFETHLEKVVDVSLLNEPSPAMAASIGIDGKDEQHRYFADRCTALGITNIRTINRIVRCVETITPKFADYDPEVPPSHRSRFSAGAATIWARHRHLITLRARRRTLNLDGTQCFSLTATCGPTSSTSR
jgi:hypothetical protein